MKLCTMTAVSTLIRYMREDSQEAQEALEGREESPVPPVATAWSIEGDTCPPEALVEVARAER